MKRLLITLLIGILIVTCTACGSSSRDTDDQKGGEAAAEESAAHKIAVLVYDRTDDEVMSFKHYLEDYIAKEFDVEFLYSDSIASGDEALSFIEEAADYGCEGVMSFNSYDLQAEVNLAEEKGIYFMMASGTVADEAFQAVADSKAFLGVVGPGDEIEYKAGADLAEHALKAAEESEEKSFFILSGGAAVGNEMHRLRTVGLIEKLEDAYGVKFDRSASEIAASEDVLTLEAGDVKICVCPGYPRMDGVPEKISEAYGSDEYGIVLGVLPVAKLKDTFSGAAVGVVDCYSENNLIMFNSGELSFVTGKYSSIIGPSFAAMYNAVTGHADEFREDGKAFHITQGFWSSDTREDYEEKYSIASSLETCAYNYADLQSVMAEFNPDATLGDLEALAYAYTYEDAVERRAE